MDNEPENNLDSSALSFREPIRPQFRLLSVAILFGALLILTSAVILAIVPQIGFTHLACKMEEDALGSSLSHARTLVRDLQISSGILKDDGAGIMNINVPELRKHLQAQSKDNPAMLYAMVVSSGGRILVHTYGTAEGLPAWETTRKASPPQGFFAEFPNGRFGFNEFVYEVLVPFDAENWKGLALVIGISKKRIEGHINEVRNEMIFRMSMASGLGLIALSIPVMGLLYVLRRYRLLARRSQQVAHMAQMGEVAKGLAHEIRNPLNSVRFNIKIIEEELDRFAPPETQEVFKQIIKRTDVEIGRVDEMLTEYLNYVRPAPIQTTSQDINAVAEEVLSLLDYECRRNKITIHREFTKDLPRIMIDSKQIRQVILNVVLNAQQALRPAGGNIRVRTFPRGDTIILEVEDDGPGIPEEDQEKIFEPFFTRRDGGTGLGLSIARRLMDNHGGSIHCRGKTGRGVVFFMIFRPKAAKIQ